MRVGSECNLLSANKAIAIAMLISVREGKPRFVVRNLLVDTNKFFRGSELNWPIEDVRWNETITGWCKTNS